MTQLLKLTDYEERYPILKMSEPEQTEEQDVVDLIEYRLKKYIDTFYQGTAEWNFASRILLMYLTGDITIRWCSEGMVVEHLRAVVDDQPARLLLPSSGPEMKPIPLGEE